MKYYGFWRSLAACRVRIALALKGVKAEEISVNLMQGEQLKPEYRAVNAQAVVPALVLDDGSTLFESMAIIEYLDETHPEPPLLPKDPKGRARVPRCWRRSSPATATRSSCRASATIWKKSSAWTRPRAPAGASTG